MTRYPTLSALCLAGVSGLLMPAPVRAEENSPPAASLTAAASALADLEARSPKDWSNQPLITEINVSVISLVGTNTLSSAEDFSRAANLLNRHLGEFRTGRVSYELFLVAAAKGHPGAESALPISWDILLGLLGRPCRIDVGGMASANPGFFQLEPAPACIQAVLRNPNAARVALTTTIQDNPEIRMIVDADQAVRKTNWSTLTDEQRKEIKDGDRQRNVRMIEIVNAGDVHTANDFSRASLVMQHSPAFSGFQLAHELAVCSMLLGDRRTGRWLVAATYDRMLRSVGHDQRFGTQMGPDGPLRVDETGICDAERVALGCPTLEQARARQSRGSPVVSKLTQELVGPDNTINDTKKGVSAKFPAGWTIAVAAPVGEQATSIGFVIPDHADASLGFYYRIYPAAPPAPINGPEALLREDARKKVEDRKSRLPDYKNRPDSFVYRQVNGQPCLSWIADYTRDGRHLSEYLTRILGKSSVALLFLNAPTGEIEALRPAVDSMAETVKLP